MRKYIIAMLAIIMMLIAISTCTCSCGNSYVSDESSNRRRPIGRLSYFDYGGGVSQVEIVYYIKSSAGIEVITVDGDVILSSCFSLKLY